MRLGRLLVPLAVGLATVIAVPATPAFAALPAYAHIVVVIEENHSYSEIIGSSSAPYITSLANNGAKMTQSFAVTHAGSTPAVDTPHWTTAAQPPTKPWPTPADRSAR